MWRSYGALGMEFVCGKRRLDEVEREKQESLVVAIVELIVQLTRWSDWSRIVIRVSPAERE